MADKKEKKKTSPGQMAMWILMGLLIIGLGGFGVDGVLNGSVNRVARVGDKDVDVQTYARALQRQMQQISQQAERPFSFAEARQNGVDRLVLEQLMRERALDHEASNMGISIGDENLRDQIVEIPAFQGLDGTFDRESYRFALENSGLSEGQFETRLREESARRILQGAIVSGVVMPDTFVDTLVGYVAETRDFTWVSLNETNLDQELAEPDEETLLAYYNDNLDEFELPESKRITYVILQPDDLLDEIEVAEADLEAEYEARRSEFNTPERRLVERLVYLDEGSAEAAAAQLEVGTSFESLVEERGLSLEDVDMGDVGRLELDAAGEAVFSAETGDVVGPLPTALGPALFRVNGILPAQSRSLDDVRAILRRTLAADRARRLVESQAQNFDDLLAGGATLEELANETDLQLGSIDWFPVLGEGIAAYDNFRQEAAQLTAEDFPKILSLSDGSIYAMRLDETLPPRPDEYEDVKLNVQANWEAKRAEGLLTEKADVLVPELVAGKDFTELGLEPMEEEGLDRGSFLAGTTPEFMSTVFEMEPGDVRVLQGYGTVQIVRLNAINPASENPQAEALSEGLSRETGGAIARELFSAFSNDAILRAGREVDARALEAVHANFQ